MRHAALIQERPPENRPGTIGARDDLADDGHVFPRHAGDGRRCRHGTRGGAFLALLLSYRCQAPGAAAAGGFLGFLYIAGNLGVRSAGLEPAAF